MHFMAVFTIPSLISLLNHKNAFLALLHPVPQERVLILVLSSLLNVDLPTGTRLEGSLPEIYTNFFLARCMLRLPANYNTCRQAQLPSSIGTIVITFPSISVEKKWLFRLIQSPPVTSKPTKITTSWTEGSMSTLSGPKMSQFPWAECMPLRRSRKAPPRLSGPVRSLILGKLVVKKFFFVHPRKKKLKLCRSHSQYKQPTCLYRRRSHYETQFHAWHQFYNAQNVPAQNSVFFIIKIPLFPLKYSAVEQSISEEKIKDSYLKYTTDTSYHLQGLYCSAV